MKTRLIRPAAIVLLVVAVTLPGAADSAKSLYNKGKDAEARQNYEAAYDFYKQAYEQKPRDLAYRASYERTRFLAAASHVHRGQLLREAGKLQEALIEFQKAAEIDSSSFIAQQEMRRTQKMIDAGNATPPSPATPPPPTGLQKRVQDAQGHPVDGVPVTFEVEPGWARSVSLAPSQTSTRGGIARAIVSEPQTTGVVRVMVHVDTMTAQATLTVQRYGGGGGSGE